jgi:cephalosporin hydroxylase
VIENMSEDMFDDRPWGIGDNPMTAVKQFLKDRNDFEIDSEIDNKLLITVAPSGYLRRVRK